MNFLTEKLLDNNQDSTQLEVLDFLLFYGCI